MFKKGDTLVEVALAVGIFSLVAVSVAAVLSGSTAGAQTSLETTLAREEIDTQAEALRFVQAAYAANSNTAGNQYATLWRNITKRAVSSQSDYDELNNYAPSSCSGDYNSDLVKNKAFVINPRALGSSASSSLITSTSTLQQATTYPRLVYSTNTNLIENSTNTNLSRAEGIYVIAAKDPGSTNIIDLADGSKKTSAYYDFYIRSCWYGIDSDNPSTISTVIRLYDPDVIEDLGKVFVTYDRYFSYKLNTEIPRHNATNNPVRYIKLEDPGTRAGWTFRWQDKYGNSYKAGAKLINNDNSGTNYYTLSGVWQQTQYIINYNIASPNSGATTQEQQTCKIGASCRISLTPKSEPDYTFEGWCKGGVSNGKCNGTKYTVGQVLTNLDFASSMTINLKPIWKPVSYPFIPSADYTWKKGSSSDLNINLNLPGSYELNSAYLDDASSKCLRDSTLYYSYGILNNITISASCLKTFSTGGHTIKFEFADKTVYPADYITKQYTINITN